MTKYVKPKKKRIRISFQNYCYPSLKNIQDIELYKTKCFNFIFNNFFLF